MTRVLTLILKRRCRNEARANPLILKILIQTTIILFKQQDIIMNKITPLIFLWLICTPLWAADSFPPLVPEGEQLANSPEELEKLIQDSIAPFGEIKSITYNPDGQSLTAVYQDNTIRMWEIATGKELRHLQRHIDKVNSSAAHSPDGQQRASGSSETVQILDVATGRELIRLKGHTNRVTSVAYSLDGKQVASGSTDGTVRIWEVATGKELMRLERDMDDVHSVAYRPDGQQLASGSKNNTVGLWELTTGKERMRLKGHTARVTSVAYHPDGQQLVSGSDDKIVRIWEIATGKELRQLQGHTDEITSIAYSPDGQQLASSSFYGIVRVWEVATGKELMQLKGRPALLKVATGKEFMQLKGHTPLLSEIKVKIFTELPVLPEVITGIKSMLSPVLSVAYSPDGQQLASVLGIWEVDTGKELMRFELGYSFLNSVAYSPDGQTLASGSWDKTVQIWKVATGKELIRLEGHTSVVDSVAYSPNGQQLASGSDDKTVRIWKVATGKEVMRLEGHTDGVNSVAYHSDGQQLISGSSDGTVRVWDSKTGKTQQILVGGKNNTWLSCQYDTGRCLRYDDGRLLKRKDEKGFLSPVLPPKEAGQLTIIDSPKQLQIEEANPQTFTITVKNTGEGRIFWVDIIHDIIRDKSNQSPLLFYKPETIVVLEPNQEKTLQLQVSALENYSHPPGENQAILKLGITHAYGELEPLKIPITVYTPKLEILDVSINQQFITKNLLVSLKNAGQQILAKTQFIAKIADITLTKVTLSKADKEENFTVSFALPNELELNEDSHLMLVARKSTLPIHQWTFPDQPIQLPPPPWYLYATVVLGIVIFMALIYYWRVFRHPLLLSVSAPQQKLYEIPLEQLPLLQNLLKRSKRWKTVLSDYQIPASRWQMALDFYHQPQANLLSQPLAPIIAKTENPLPWLLIVYTNEQFMLNIPRCFMALPPKDLSAEEIITQVKTVAGTTQINLCLILTTDIEQRTLLIQQRQTLKKDNISWVIPTSADLTRLLLSSPTKTDEIFAQIIASQVKITRISPYIIGGGVNKGSMFFGREQLLSDIQNNDPRNYLLVGARQLGKTSLLKELQRRYQQHPDIQCYLLSVGEGKNKLQDSLKRLNTELQLPQDSDLETVLKCLAHPPAGTHTILLIDEADDFIKQEKQNNYTTLHTFRSLSEEGRCHFILAGFWELYSAASLDYQSPVKNFGKTLTISGLEPEACHELITKPMAALNIHYANAGLVEHIIEQTGRRANLISIVCNEILQQLEQRRIIEATDVETAFDSQAVETAFADWGELVGPLARIIVYATIEQAPFTLKTLWQQLNAGKITYQVEEVKQALTRLELSFIINRQKDQYSYRVPLFCEMLKRQGPQEMLQEELKHF